MILFPRGMGGNWLSNLIWHLEHNRTDVPSVDVIFDGAKRCSIPFSHSFEIPDPHCPDQVQYYAQTGTVFSCKHLFIHYLNNAVKVKYRIHQLDQQPWQQQLFDLSNGARYYLTNEHYYDHYCKDIGLDYSLIFTDPDQFITDLFALLNKLNVQYTANKDYVLKSIAYYRSTCPDPGDHFDNFDSILWLGMCHAVALVDNLTITESIIDIDSAQRLLKPLAAHCADRIQPLMFEWTK